ncbi:3-carboxy-cis,cis-muconate cycloisomerase [Lichenibacterium minor]|uniref:3-carboxy-cis,cis-muconate cycloisomerase n=1 Tax=Lichenibacterium minor TaxID=2316528 RepID=A0A4Q2UAA3_9HYPH|nr:3-carboxy-cis,cis-muconate cycloisomerase [Lichenibacterium minor]RYC33540.1 3-carboxy-cis,cis-muconate cycloisomerase [Lichenibacterium minor]
MTLLSALAGDPELEALFTDAADLAAMLRFESALAEAQAAAGLIPAEAAAGIADVCAGFTPDWAALRAGLARDGVVVPELVRQLRATSNAIYAKYIHVAATSQDVIDTGLALRLAPALDVLDLRLDALDAALAALSARDGAAPLMAQTRMQRALPFTAADKVDTWRGPLPRHRARLAELRPRLIRLQLGGPVGTRAELGPQAGAVAERMAGRLGLADAPAWHSQRDGVVEFGGWLALVCGSLGKMGQDVALMVQNEVGAAKLAGGGTSSAMAHKSNPVPAELLVALARYAAGLSGTLTGAMVHENERSGAAWTLEWLVLPGLVVAAGAALATALSLIENLSFPSRPA